MGNGGSDYYLRPEAGPVPYGKLQKRAKVALKNIVGFLSAGVRSAKVPSENTATDTNRASRIFFVSGEPGSGKSTLYLTLKEMLSDKDGSGKYSEGCKDDIDLSTNLSTLKGAVRWLDTLDLEVAGDEGENLLAAVLVRLIEVLINPESGSNTVHSKHCEEAIKDLEELATDIGIAWEGNLQARAGELDPDTYSEEVMRTQRARLGVNERLKKALDKLAKHGCYGCHEGTLFVLPVDDFYLKPHASLQLLRLLRMISIPRLFFLVMGDITTIEALFVEKALKDWTAVAGPEIFASLKQRQDEALARARELRARYLRKLLPPGQRAEIEAMDWDEALDFKPERLNGKDTNAGTFKAAADTPIVGTLKNLLEKENLDPPSDNSSLLTFLISPPLETSEKVSSEEENREREKIEKNIRRAQEAYTALQILDATSREIMDLWFALYELKKTPKITDAPPLLSCVLDFVKLVIEEQNFLNEEQLADLRDGVLPTRHYSPRDIQFNMDRLSLEPDPNTWEDPTQVDKNQERKEPPKERLWVRSHRSWKLAAKTDEGESKDEAGLFAKLPPRQTAWIILLHDLAWKWKSESVTGNLVKKLLTDLDDWSKKKPKPSSQSKKEKNIEVKELRFEQLVELLAMCKKRNSRKETQDILAEPLDPSKDFQGWAIWQNGLTYTHFPRPNFDTFRDLDRFLFVWSTGFEWLHELWKRANRAEELAREAEAEQKRAKAKQAKHQVSVNNAEEQSQEARNIANSAEQQAKEAEADLIDKRVKAKEAKEQVGADDLQQQLKKYLDLWGLAGWVVINEKKYEDFARRTDNWFVEQLAIFENVAEINEQSKKSKDWISKIKNFPEE